MRKEFFALLLLLVIVVFRSPALLWPALEEDEACHFTSGVVIADGERPYEDVVDGKTPLLWYLFGAVAKVFGPFNTKAYRFFTDFNVWITALLIWWLGSLVGSPQAGRWGGLLFSLFSTCSTYKILASNYELHLLPFDLLAYCFFALSLKKRQALFGFLSGAFIATSFFVKQTAGINLATLMVILILLAFSKTWRRFAVQAFLTLLLGFGAALGGYVAWITSKGVLDQMLFWTWHYAWILTEKSFVSLPFFNRFSSREGAWVLGTFIVHYWAVRFMWIFFRGLKGESGWGFEKILQGVVILWAFFEWVPISLGGRFPIHYFLMYLPPLSLLAGFWIAGKESVESFFGQILKPKRLAWIILFFFIPVVGTFIASWNVEGCNRLVGLKRADHAKLAKRIQQETAPQDRIFVWGHNPEFYVFAKRRPASRFLFLDFMTGRHGIPSKYMKDPAAYDALAIEEAWPLLFKDFEKHPPSLIVDTSPADLHDYKVFPISRYPRLYRYVTENYRLGWVEDDVYFYIRK